MPPLARGHSDSEGPTGIEPAFLAWEANVLPLDDDPEFGSGACADPTIAVGSSAARTPEFTGCYWQTAAFARAAVWLATSQESSGPKPSSADMAASWKARDFTKPAPAEELFSATTTE